MPEVLARLKPGRREFKLPACGLLHFLDGDFANERLPIGCKATVIGGEARQMRQLHALHSCFDPAQGMPPDHDFMGGEHQAEPLLHFLRVALSEYKLVEGKRQGVPGGSFDAERASVGITRPAFG